MNFHAPAEQVLKIIEGGVMCFKNLLKVRDKYSLDRRIFEVEPHGDAGDPKTTYTILPNEKLNKEQLKEIEDLRLHNLATAALTPTTSPMMARSSMRASRGANCLRLDG